MGRFRRILVPADLTQGTDGAVNVAREFADPGGSGIQIIVLHVIETLDAPFEELQEFYRRLETNARKRLTAIVEPLIDSGIAAEQHIAYGKPVPEIVAHATDHAVDLIVIASHRLDPEQPARSLMTIGHQVTLLAPCPVLVLK